MTTKIKIRAELISDIIAAFGIVLVFAVILSGSKLETKKAQAELATVSTEAPVASDITAVLKGSVFSSESPISSRGFQWGQDSSYGNTTADSSAILPVRFTSQRATGLKPNSVAARSDGSFAILNSEANKVLIYDNSGNLSNEVGGTKGSGNYEFDAPSAIIFDSNGNLLVADTNNNRIQKYDSSLAYSGTISDSSMMSPIGLAYDKDNNLYVIDSQNSRVQKFDLALVPQTIFGGSEIDQPKSIAVDSEGNLYVADKNGLEKFNSTGNFIQRIGNQAFTSVAIDSKDKIYVSSLDDYIKVYEKSGQFQLQFSGNGSDATNFNQISQLSFDSNDNLFVAESDKSKVNKFASQESYSLGDFSLDIGNLSCSTRYHFRAFVSNGDGTAYGNDASFVTLPCGSSRLFSPMSMSIQTNSPTAVGSFSATLNGDVTATSAPTTKRGFEWGTTASLGNLISGEATEASRNINPSSAPWPIASNLPTGVAIDKNLQRVYVSDPNNNQIGIYDFAGNTIATYSPGTLSDPNGLAVDGNGRIYIADSGNDRIVVINSDLTLAGSMGGPGPNPQNLSNPHGVAIDTFGNAYVADTGNDKIKRYDSSFTYDASGSFGTTGSGATGEFNNPLGIAISQSGSNKIIVADTGNSRYQVFEQSYSSGPPISITPVAIPSLIVDGSSSGTAFVSPASVAIDVKNNVYVADTGNDRIAIFREDGSFTSTYGSITNLNSPYGIATYTQPESNPTNNDALLFIADQNNSEVEKFLTQGEFSPAAFSNTLNFLNCGTTYFYRAVATNSTGDYNGATETFTTNPCNTNISVTTLPPDNIAGTFATLNSSFNFVGDPQLKSQGYQWGSSNSLGNTILNTNVDNASYLDLATQWTSGLNTPIDTATDSDGNVYVSDSANNKLKKYNNNGGFITEWAVTNPRGIGQRLGYIWVANQAGISKYQSDGTFIATFTDGIGATDVAADDSEYMYATFPEGYVLKLNPGGSPDRIIGYYSANVQENLGYFPTGIDIKDGDSVMFVADTTKNRIAKYSLTGVYGGDVGSFGSEKGQYILPGFVDYSNSALFITDSTGSLTKTDETGGTIYYKDIINSMIYTGSINSILSGVSVDVSGNIFVTSPANNLVKKYYQKGLTSAVAGSYPSVLGQLNCGSTYYYRAFASNGVTNFFGDIISFQTISCSLIPSIINPIPAGTFPEGVFSSAQPGGGAGIISDSSGPISQLGRGGIITSIDNALQGILNITKRVSREIATAIPFLLIFIILFFALIYAIQSYRELKSSERYNILIDKYENLQFGSKNFIALTNHYLNTPISIMQLSGGVLLSAGIITKEKYNDINSLMRNITNSVHELLEKNTSATEKFMSDINPQISSKKAINTSFNPLAWFPIVIAGLLVVLANLLFLRAEVLSFSYASLIIQIGLFALSALFVLLAWRSLNRNREIRKQRAITLKKELELSKYKINFINEASTSIDQNIVKIEKIVAEFGQDPQAKSFVRGVAMLSGVQKSFELLKKFSAFSPTGSVNESDVNEVTSKILERQANALERKNLKIKTNISDELNLRLDKSALILLLGSAINNAVKFSKPNGTIYLDVENKIHGSKITIKDQGIGIPKDKIDQLMMPFARASDALQYDYEGLGLGLYLDRIIIEQIGGTIKISSELGKGTTVEFEVPRGINQPTKNPQKDTNKATQQIKIA